ncbi:E1 ubiquitin-activating protein aos1 [Teratosphaeriaceae sp. CCFEE 6253]|nr:E1 ubiquitin-activating protein aos1 [Teratosphaeriaceae sp. CCFEE 6253]
MAADLPTGSTGLLSNGAGVPANGNAAYLENGDGTTMTTGLSADEIAQYDRQLRLWGVEAQNRIRSANILLVSLRALGTEIAKNLTLAGISSLTIIDDEPVTEENLGTQYFVREEDVGRPRAEAAIPRIQDLNPRVLVTSGGSLAALLQQDQTFYAPFSCVIACDHDFPTLSTLNTTARFAAVPFYAAAVHGFHGFLFADLVTHDFVLERERSNVATQLGPERGSATRSVVSVTAKRERGGGRNMEVVQKREIYCPLLLANSSPLPADTLASKRKLRAVPALLPCLRALFDFQRTFARLPSTDSAPDLAVFTQLATGKAKELQLPAETLQAAFLRSFMQSVGAEIVPTAAFVGGRLAEDVINVLGKREQPVQNLALFDGEALEGRVYCLFSPPPEVVMVGGLAGLGGGGEAAADCWLAGAMGDAGAVGDGLVSGVVDGVAGGAGPRESEAIVLD